MKNFFYSASKDFSCKRCGTIFSKNCVAIGVLLKKFAATFVRDEETSPGFVHINSNHYTNKVRYVMTRLD